MDQSNAAKRKGSPDRTGLQKAGAVLGKIGHGIGQFFLWIYKLRKIFMAAVVAWIAVRLALDNFQQLPQEVGVFIQTNGTYALTISRQVAVFGPLLVTAVCLVLMFCSRKALYPWLISIFTLVLPVLMRLSILLPF